MTYLNQFCQAEEELLFNNNIYFNSFFKDKWTIDYCCGCWTICRTMALSHQLEICFHTQVFLIYNSKTCTFQNATVQTSLLLMYGLC